LLLLRFLSRLPLRILYFVSDFIFFTSYYIIRYRRKITRKNLVKAFPGKPVSTITKIEKQFYRNLSDTAVETLKLLTSSERHLLERVKVDSSLTRQLKKEGCSVFAMTAHFCNWEWLLVASSNQLGLDVHAAYKKLRSPFFDHLMQAIRSRFGAVLHEKDVLVQDILNMKKSTYLMAMVADQRPFSGDHKYWTKFMNQDAAFLTGTELLAKRKDIKVIYARMKRVRRGYYEVNFEIIELQPKNSQRGQITEKFIALVEEDIHHDPAAYLWSHDRWKLKKPEATLKT
jgi:KDO2-lipid IV(A) lauroyltransferase